jgi:hypothetical protein
MEHFTLVLSPAVVSVHAPSKAMSFCVLGSFGKTLAAVQ